MNKQQLILLLMESFSGIDIHQQCIKELLGLIVKSGREAKFLTLFRIRIIRLLEMRAEAVRDKEFESIGDGLFSMHISGAGFNIRILYSFLPDRRPILLLAFYERGGKKKTDYTTHIPPAVDRLNETRRCQ